MIKRQYDFHIYLQYRNDTPESVNANGSEIVKVDIFSSVRSYTLKGGPDNPIRYMEMTLDRATVIERYPYIIDNIVEGETRLIVDAVDSGTFIISKVWLKDHVYEIVALGSESVIKGTLVTVGYENTRPAGIADVIYNIWAYSADWNGDYDTALHYSRDIEDYEANPITVNNDMASAVALQLCALADDAFTFFANTFSPSEIICSYDAMLSIAVGDQYFFEMEYTSYLSGETVRLHIDYKVKDIDAENRRCTLICLENNDYGDLSKEIRDYLVKEYKDEGRVYLYRNDDTDRPIADRRRVEYIETKVYAHYTDSMFYVKYDDIDPVNPDTMYPDRSGEINIYANLDDYNRRYTDFDRFMFEKSSEIAHKNADASSTVINRQDMLYYDTATHKEGDKTVENGLANIGNTNGKYSLTDDGPMNPYYTGGTHSIASYGVHEGAYLINAYLKYNSKNFGVSTVQRIVNSMVRRYRDPPQSISFTVKESKTDEFGYIGWERTFEPFAYAVKVNDDIHKIYLTNAHRCDGVEDKSMLRLSSFVRHYPEMTTTYTFGATRDSGLSQMIADLNQRSI